MGQTASSHSFTIDTTAHAFQTVPTAQTHRAMAPTTTGEAIPSCDVAIADWDDLLSAVKSRLRQTVGGGLAPISEQHGPDAARQVQASVLECVTALDQLHLTLTHELGRRDSEWPARQWTSHDGLTALPNHSRFHARLKQALADSELRLGLALICLGLDGFEAINEEHGHEAGDEVLRIIAARLVRTIRADDAV